MVDTSPLGILIGDHPGEYVSPEPQREFSPAFAARMGVGDGDMRAWDSGVPELRGPMEFPNPFAESMDAENPFADSNGGGLFADSNGGGLDLVRQFQEATMIRALRDEIEELRLAILRLEQRPVSSGGERMEGELSTEQLLDIMHREITELAGRTEAASEAELAGQAALRAEVTRLRSSQPWRPALQELEREVANFRERANLGRPPHSAGFEDVPSDSMEALQIQLFDLREEQARISIQQRSFEESVLKQLSGAQSADLEEARREVEIVEEAVRRLQGSCDALSRDFHIRQDMFLTECSRVHSPEEQRFAAENLQAIGGLRAPAMDDRYDSLAREVQALRDLCVAAPMAQALEALGSELQKLEKSTFSEIKKLEASLEAESSRRCMLVADLHSRLARETAEATRNIEVRMGDLTEQIKDESRKRQGAVSELHSIRRTPPPSSASLSDAVAKNADGSVDTAQSLADLLMRDRNERTAAATSNTTSAAENRLEVSRALQVERERGARSTAQLRSELTRAVDKEREARSQLGADLLKAIMRERDERITDCAGLREEVTRLVSEWHARMRKVNNPGLVDREGAQPPRSDYWRSGEQRDQGEQLDGLLGRIRGPQAAA